MKYVYIFNQMTMNGTVVLRTEPAAFATEELANKTRNAVIEANKGMAPFSCACSEVKKVEVYESESEVPILAYVPITAPDISFKVDHPC